MIIRGNNSEIYYQAKTNQKFKNICNDLDNELFRHKMVRYIKVGQDTPYKIEVFDMYNKTFIESIIVIDELC